MQLLPWHVEMSMRVVWSKYQTLKTGFKSVWCLFLVGRTIYWLWWNNSLRERTEFVWDTCTQGMYCCIDRWRNLSISLFVYKILNTLHCFGIIILINGFVCVEMKIADLGLVWHKYLLTLKNIFICQNICLSQN